MTIIDPRITEALELFRQGLQILAELQTDAVNRNRYLQASEGRLMDVETGLDELANRFSMFLEQYTHALAERELGG